MAIKMNRHLATIRMSKKIKGQWLAGRNSALLRKRNESKRNCLTNM